jgi:hypothetical protein
MGGDTAIGRGLRKWPGTRKHFWNNADPKHARKLVGKVVEIEDLLIRLNDLRGRSYTGDHLYNVIMRPAKEKLCAGRIVRYVACFDKTPIVPLRKSYIQNIRDRSRTPPTPTASPPPPPVPMGAMSPVAPPPLKRAPSEFEDNREPGAPSPPSPEHKIIAYSDKSWITDGGIWDPEIGVDNETGAVPKICINSILATRSSRHIIMLYLHQRIMLDKVLKDFEVILDYATVPYFIYRGMSYKLPQCHSPFGEAEMMCVKWARVHNCATRPPEKNYNTIITTIDLDIMGLGMKWIESCSPPMEVLWHVGRERKEKYPIYDRRKGVDEYCDMKGVVKGLWEHHQVSTNIFVLAFILCGIDYHSKNNIFMNVTAEWIIHRMILGSKHLIEAIRPSFEWLLAETDVCWRKPVGVLDFNKPCAEGFTTAQFITGLDALADEIRNGTTTKTTSNKYGYNTEQGCNDVNWSWYYMTGIDWRGEPGCQVCPEVDMLRDGTTELPTREVWDDYLKAYPHSKFKYTPLEQFAITPSGQAKSKRVARRAAAVVIDDDDDEVVAIEKPLPPPPPKPKPHIESKDPITAAPPSPPPPPSLPRPPISKPKRKAATFASDDDEDPKTKRLRALYGWYAPQILGC